MGGWLVEYRCPCPECRTAVWSSKGNTPRDYRWQARLQAWTLKLFIRRIAVRVVAVPATVTKFPSLPPVDE